MNNHVITRAVSIFLSVMLTICTLDIPYQVYAKEPETDFLTAKVSPESDTETEDSFSEENEESIEEDEQESETDIEDNVLEELPGTESNEQLESETENNETEENIADSAAEEVEEFDTSYNSVSSSGACGENVTWELTSIDSEDHLQLIIAGTGDMNGYNSQNMPWYQQRNQIVSAVINEGVTSIGNYAFSNCKALTEINLPDSLTSIGQYAFSNCTGLTEVVLPDNLTSMGIYAFEKCTGLTKVNIPAGLTSGTYAFSECVNLKDVEIESGIETIPRGLFSNSGIESITIPEGTRNIDNYAFENCKSLTEINLPESLENIGSEAFRNCITLTTVELPEGLKNLGGTLGTNGNWSVSSSSYAEVFSECTSLEEVTLPKALENGNIVFSGCTSLKTVHFREGTTGIVSGLFRNCGGLESISIPDTVTTIGNYAFSNCKALTEINLPDSLTSIGQYAFSNCTGLTEVVLPDNLTSMGIYAFEKCTGLTKVNIPAGLTSGTYAFSECVNLKDVEIESGIETIPRGLFSNSGIESITIPEGTRNIDNYAFENCKSLTEIYLPESVVSVGNDAFGNCPDLTIYCSKYSKLIINYIDNNINVISYNDNRTLPSTVLDDSKSFYEARNTAGSSFVCHYSIDSSVFKTILNPYIKIKIPTGATITSGTLYHNDDLCTDYRDYTSYITIPVSENEGKISFNLTFSGDIQVVTYATLNYRINGKEDFDIIDIINNDIPLIVVNAEQVTSSDSVHITGIAPVSSEVNISVDGQLVSSVNSNKVGSYNADIILPSVEDEKEYTIKVSSEYNGAVITDETTVKYKENAPELVSFTMQYKGGTYDLMSGKKYSISFVPKQHYPFRFEVVFTNPDQIGSVIITSFRNQVNKSVEAVWDEEAECFVFEGFFDEGNYSYVPGRITARYVLKGESINESTEEALAEIIQDAVVTENVRTEDEINADIDFGNGNVWNYEYKGNVTIEELENEFFDGENILSSDSKTDMLRNRSADIGSGHFFIEFLKKLIEKYGEKVFTNVVTNPPAEEFMEAYVSDEDRNSVDHIYYDPAKKVIAKETIKYTVGTGAYWLNSTLKTDLYLPFKSSVKMGGVVVSAGKTLIDYGGQMYDVNKVENKIKDSKTMSSSQKTGYLQELNTARNTYTLIAGFDIAMACTGIFVTAALGPFGGFLFGALTGVISKILKDNADDLVDLIDTGVSSEMTFLVDPSGYVYEAVMTNRLYNVKVTTYWIPYDENNPDFWEWPNENNAVRWDAEEYSQENPLYTDFNGDYAWDVPEGWWKVVAEKEGYNSYSTEWLPVPPPQTNINISLVRIAKPEVESVSKTEDGRIEVVFDSYMIPSTVSDIVLLDNESNIIEYNLNYDDSETDVNGVVFARIYYLELSDDVTIDDVKVLQVPDTLLNYANNAVAEYDYDFTKPDGPISVTGVTLDQTELKMYISDTAELKATVEPSDADNQNVTWTSDNEDVATVDENGKVTGKKPGTANITVTTEDGGYTDSCKVTVLFDDVTQPSQYYYDAVYWAVENNITQGMGPTTFNPGGFCKRYQFVLFLWRQAGCPEPELTEDPFTDVLSDPKKDVYEKAVLWAVDKEITTGTTPTTFDPYAPLTRGQVVTFLYRAAGKPEVSTTTNPFKDLDSSKYYYTPVLWAVENEITTGLNASQFGPVNTCTRGQTVLFMYRLFGKE